MFRNLPAIDIYEVTISKPNFWRVVKTQYFRTRAEADYFIKKYEEESPGQYTLKVETRLAMLDDDKINLIKLGYKVAFNFDEVEDWNKFGNPGRGEITIAKDVLSDCVSEVYKNKYIHYGQGYYGGTTRTVFHYALEQVSLPGQDMLYFLLNLKKIIALRRGNDLYEVTVQAKITINTTYADTVKHIQLLDEVKKIDEQVEKARAALHELESKLEKAKAKCRPFEEEKEVERQFFNIKL